MTWLHESSRFASSHVYAGEVIEAAEAVARGSLKVETVDLPKDCLKAAGELAERHAARLSFFVMWTLARTRCCVARAEAHATDYRSPFSTYKN